MSNLVTSGIKAYCGKHYTAYDTYVGCTYCDKPAPGPSRASLVSLLRCLPREATLSQYDWEPVTWRYHISSAQEDVMDLFRAGYGNITCSKGPQQLLFKDCHFLIIDIGTISTQESVNPDEAFLITPGLNTLIDCSGLSKVFRIRS